MTVLSCTRTGDGAFQIKYVDYSPLTTPGKNGPITSERCRPLTHRNVLLIELNSVG